MKNRRIMAETVLAASALCWAFWGSTVKVDTVPAPAAESAVSAPCAPQTQPTEPINKIDISEPVTESETIPVAGSIASPASPKQKCPQETPMVVPTSTLAEEPIAKSPTEEAPQPHDGMIYVPGFGWLQSEGPGEWSVSENMYENGNKVGLMG